MSAGGPPLVGRAADLAIARALLNEHRVLTLTGPAGVGKTRLAHELAASVAVSYPDGVLVVELAQVEDPARLPAVVARAAGIGVLPEASHAVLALARALRPLSLLLVLDNCEHLLRGAAGLVEVLVTQAPAVRMLVTSQEPLHVPAECVYRLPPLSVPPDAVAAQAGGWSAADLLLAHVRRLQPGFQPDEDGWRALAAICRELDGMPLALELAAARVPVLGLSGVRERLHEPLQLLTRGGGAGRHDALRNALQWSHALLSPRDQRTFRRLGVFRGTWSLAALQGVDGEGGDSEWSVIDRLQGLVDKSLVQVVDARPQPRYRLLESTRALALAQLAAAGEQQETRRRHATVVQTLFEQADASFFGAPLLSWVERWLPELDNLRDALRWSLGVDGDATQARRLVAAAAGFFSAAALESEADEWLQAVQPGLDDAPACERARIWLGRGLRAVSLTPVPAKVFAAATQALGAAREADDPVLVYRALHLTVMFAHGSEGPVDADSALAEMVRLEGEHWTPLQRHLRRTLQARALARQGDIAAARERFAREASLLGDHGDAWRAWLIWHNVALNDCLLGHPQRGVAVMRPVVTEIFELRQQRRCWAQVAMLALAEIEARGPEADDEVLRDAVRGMRVAGSVWWLGDHLACWAAQRGCPEVAARVLGWTQARQAVRKEPPSALAMRARQRTEALLGRHATSRVTAGAGDRDRDRDPWQREREEAAGLSEDEIVAGLRDAGLDTSSRA